MEKHVVRICEQKIKGDISLSWEELAQELNFRNGEILRQNFKAYRKKIGTLPSRCEHITKEAELKINELDKKIMEEKKERIKLQREKLDIQRWLRNQSKFELIGERIDNLINYLEPIFIPDIIIREESHKSGIVGLADMHYGKKVLIKGLDGRIINRYNSNIFEERMWYLLEEILRIIKKEELNEINIVNLADAIDGIIHIGQLQNAEFGAIDSIIKLSEFLSQWLTVLSNHVRVNYYSTLGNHPEIRPLGSKAGELDKENLERILHEFLSIRLKNNPNIDIKDCNKLSYMNILGCNVLSVHGQLEKGNLEQSIKDYMLMYKQDINLLLAGHLHSNHSKSIGINVDFVQFNSICGADDFGVKIHKISNAGTKLLIIEEGKGKTIDYNIDLQHII